MSDPLDPVAAGVASLLKSLRTRAGLQEDRLSGTELTLDPLTGLESGPGLHVAAGDKPERAIVRAVRDAASSLEPTLSIVADVSLSLELSAAAIPENPELYAPDLDAAARRCWPTGIDSTNSARCGPPDGLRRRGLCGLR